MHDTKNAELIATRNLGKRITIISDSGVFEIRGQIVGFATKYTLLVINAAIPLKGTFRPKWPTIKMYIDSPALCAVFLCEMSGTEEIYAASINEINNGAISSLDIVPIKSNYPHQCPNCKGPALMLFSSIECKKKCK